MNIKWPPAKDETFGDKVFTHVMFAWVVASIIGVLLANFIPTTWGLGFAGILCLVGILCSLANTRLRRVAALVAGAAAVAAYSLPLKLNIVAAIAFAVLACMVLESRRLPAREERAA